MIFDTQFFLIKYGVINSPKLHGFVNFQKLHFYLLLSLMCIAKLYVRLCVDTFYVSIGTISNLIVSAIVLTYNPHNSCSAYIWNEYLLDGGVTFVSRCSVIFGCYVKAKPRLEQSENKEK